MSGSRQILTKSIHRGWGDGRLRGRGGGGVSGAGRIAGEGTAGHGRGERLAVVAVGLHGGGDDSGGSVVVATGSRAEKRSRRDRLLGAAGLERHCAERQEQAMG